MTYSQFNAPTGSAAQAPVAKRESKKTSETTTVARDTKAASKKTSEKEVAAPNAKAAAAQASAAVATASSPSTNLQPSIQGIVIEPNKSAELSATDKMARVAGGDRKVPELDLSTTVYGPRTIAITVRPDFTQEDVRSPGRACTMLAMFSPPNAPPLEARWIFEWSLYSTDSPAQNDGKPHREEQAISRTQRAILWYGGRAFDKYKNCVVQQKCRFAPELEPLSIVFRVDPKDQEPQALVWVRRSRVGARRRRDLSYLKVARNHFYHLNITFSNGDVVHRYVHQLGWRFTLFLLTKKQRRGVDEITMTRLFTNFSTAWVNGNEPAPDAAELDMANAARALDAEEDREDQNAPPAAPAKRKGTAAAGSKGEGEAPAAGSAPQLPSQGVPIVAETARDCTAFGKESGNGSGALMGFKEKDPGHSSGAQSADARYNAAMITSAVPDMFRQPPRTYDEKTKYDHFSPMPPLPPQPSAPLMTALMQHIGGQTLVRPPLPPRHPQKPIAQCTWPADVMSLLSHPVPDRDLPDIDELEREPALKVPFAMDALVERFVTWKNGDGSLAGAMCDVERVVRMHAQDRKSPIVDGAKVIMNTLSAVAQLPGWQHVQDYINDPTAYVNRIQMLGAAYVKDPAAGSAATGHGTSASSSASGGFGHSSSAGVALLREDHIWPLQEQGKQLLQQLCLRVLWFLKLRREAAASGTQTENEVAMRAVVYGLCADRKWIADAQHFMKEAELRVTQMLTRNATRFAQFRELQKQGVAWPHGVLVRRAIELAGFTFRPMMIKRDRCVCDVCLVEVSGWRAYHNPWNFHDYGRHPPSFRQPPSSKQ